MKSFGAYARSDIVNIVDSYYYSLNWSKSDPKVEQPVRTIAVDQKIRYVQGIRV